MPLTGEREKPTMNRACDTQNNHHPSFSQAHCANSSRMPLFGQILAALYQDDIVDEDDIRRWHARPASKGEGWKPSPETEGIMKCWLIGSHMIKQFDEQESDEDDDTGSE